MPLKVSKEKFPIVSNYSRKNHLTVPFTFVLHSKIRAVVFSKQFGVVDANLSAVHLRGSQFSQNISQRFTAVEDSENTEDYRALLPLRSEKLLQYSFWRFVDTRPIVRPIEVLHGRR